MTDISYNIICHEEDESLDKLISLIGNYKQDEDEIVVIYDPGKNYKTLDILRKYHTKIKNYNIYTHTLNNDFAEHKNFAKSKCTKSWIFNIDADEYPDESLLKMIKVILEKNQNSELFRIPRINTVDGITKAHIDKWHWQLSKIESQKNIKRLLENSPEYNLLKDYGLIIHDYSFDEQSALPNEVHYYTPIINFPDVQSRIIKNLDRIQWKGKVHEIPEGYKTFITLPYDERFCLYHPKNIERQEEQNNFYASL